MLVNNKYLKYDMLLHEYYITQDCVINYTSYSSDEIARVLGNNVESTLRSISHSVYRLIYDSRKGVNKYAHKRYMRKKIYTNLNEETTVLMLAMVEAVKGAIESGMDLNAYTNEPKETLPYTVKQELRQAGLTDSSEKLDYGLDFDYTAEEIARWS